MEETAAVDEAAVVKEKAAVERAATEMVATERIVTERVVVEDVEERDNVEDADERDAVEDREVDESEATFKVFYHFILCVGSIRWFIKLNQAQGYIHCFTNAMGSLSWC